MPKKLFIFGCSGTAKSIIDSIKRSESYDINEIIFIDIKSIGKHETYYGCKVLNIGALKNIETHGQYAIFAFFKPRDIITREEFITNTVDEYGFELISIVDPSAIVSPTASIGQGCYIAPFVCVDSDSVIAANTIILFHSIISREVKILKSSFISAGCTIKGGVVIKESCFLGANCSIVKDLNCGCFVNAMTLINQTVNEPSIIYNTPKTNAILLTKDKMKAYKRLDRLG
ncbi:hypothetical protein LSUCC1028_03905 [Rhodobacterales bacterium LSUCC1028]|nr:hypothetical protein [Rhodobacterales bacterium LSUCC1028]